MPAAALGAACLGFRPPHLSTQFLQPKDTCSHTREGSVEGVQSAQPKAGSRREEGSEKDGRVIENDIKKFVLSKPKNINETKDDKRNKIKQ